jgi:hypothetical protein
VSPFQLVNPVCKPLPIARRGISKAYVQGMPGVARIT